MSQPGWRRSATRTLHAAFHLKAVVDERLRHAGGLALADYEALAHLAAGPLRMSEIADRLVLSRGGTTKLVDRLEAGGLVRRVAEPDDRRATLVEVTGTGGDAHAAATEVFDEALSRYWARHLDAEQTVAVLDAVDTVMRANGWGD